MLLHIATCDRELGPCLHSGKRAEDGKDNTGLADEGALNHYASCGDYNQNGSQKLIHLST